MQKETATVNDAKASTPAFIASLEHFAGKWRLNREITSGSGDAFVFAGRANFTWQQSGLVYNESGEVTLPNNKTMQSERTYFWRQGPANQLEVYFDDQRYFHSFSGTTPYAEHRCGDDHYKVRYTFGRWPFWTSVWQVSGPRKDYTMVSRYQPFSD